MKASRTVRLKIHFTKLITRKNGCIQGAFLAMVSPWGRRVLFQTKLRHHPIAPGRVVARATSFSTQ